MPGQGDVSRYFPCLLVGVLHPTQPGQTADTHRLPTSSPVFEKANTFQTLDSLGFHSSSLSYQTQTGQQEQKTHEPGPKNGKFANMNEVMSYLSLPPLSVF